MLTPVDDVVLDVGRKLREIGAESPDADDQVPMVFGMYLRVPQFVRVHHVVLDVRTAVCHKGVGVCRR